MPEFRIRTSAPLAFFTAALTLASAAAASASFGVDAEPPSPTRLWYRISATVEETREGGSFETKGNDPAMRVTAQYRATVKYRLRSRSAVLLYRQCLPLAAVNAVDPKVYAKLFTDGRRTTTGCGQVRAVLRRHGVSPAEIRDLRLVEDVRFTANAEGLLDEYDVGREVQAHTYRLTGGNFIPGTITCPTQTLGIARLTGAPASFEARLLTGSAVRDGVLTAFALPRPPVAVDIGSEGGPCIADPDGPREPHPVYETQLHKGAAAVRLLPTSYGTFPFTPRTPFKTGPRFGKSFTIDATQTIVEPVSPSWQTGPWVTTVVVKLKFTPCPRGGRDVGGC